MFTEGTHKNIQFIYLALNANDPTKNLEEFNNDVYNSRELMMPFHIKNTEVNSEGSSFTPMQNILLTHY